LNISEAEEPSEAYIGRIEEVLTSLGLAILEPRRGKDFLLSLVVVPREEVLSGYCI